MHGSVICVPNQAPATTDAVHDAGLNGCAGAVGIGGFQYGPLRAGLTQER